MKNSNFAARAARVVARLPLLGSTVLRMSVEDPAHFLVQMVRRLPTSMKKDLFRSPLPNTVPPVVQATWQFAGDNVEGARQALDRCAGGHWTNELRLNVGLPLDGGSINQKAQQEWELGNVDEAISLATGNKKRRLSGEKLLLTQGVSPVLPHSPLRARYDYDPLSLRPLHFLTNSLPWTNSGYSLRSHAILTAQKDAGLDPVAVTRLGYPTIIGRPQAAVAENIEGITYRRLLPSRFPNSPDRKIYLQTRMLQDAVMELGPHLIHTTTNYLNGISARTVARSVDVPWVYEMRGEMENTWVARKPKHLQEAAAASQRYQLMRARETEMARTANAVVVLSQLQAKSLVERGVPEDRIWVIPNSVDEELLSLDRDPESARSKLGLPSAFWVGTVSALVDYEGLDTLLQAVAELRNRGLDVRCLIAGDGVSRPSLVRLADDLSISEFVSFPGKVSPMDAPKWYQVLDVMVIPRRDTAVTRSVTPIKGLNAMALGIPQIVSDLPALREIAVDSGQGVAVTPDSVEALADAICSLHDDSALAKALGIAGRTEAHKRTWTEAARSYMQLYRRITH